MPAPPRAVRVPLVDRCFGALFHAWPGLGRGLAALESRIAALDGELPPIDRPVYVCGLVRSGSTVLLEALAQVPGFATHRYADFPFLYTPWWWNALRTRLPRPPAAPQERAHGDRVAVTRDSPEAFEEVFWQQAFPGRHDPAVDQVLEGDAHNAAFDAFYTLHLRKLLAARGARRYLAKANYHLTRLGYLHARFPDARFVVPLREPLSHVGSLLRQHRRFVDLARADGAIARHLVRVGHREFGPGRRAIQAGDAAEAAAIQAAFDRGRDVEGYARQWAALYGWLAARLADRDLADACLVVPYAALCARPQAVLEGVFAHAGVDPVAGADLAARLAPGIHAPDYYAPELDEADRDTVLRLTGPAWQAIRRHSENRKIGL